MDLQKTRIGFFRSLLSQIIQAIPEAVPVMFNESERAEMVWRSRSMLTDQPVCTIERLSGAFLQWRKHDPTPLYLHVDGIDEVDSDPAEIAQLLLELGTCKSTKVLAAGRDHPEFQHAFKQDRLGLHELTEPDIVRYTLDKVCTEKLRNCVTKPDKILSLLREVKESAQGVFLWVHLVLSMLVKGTHCDERFEQLMSRLRAYPKDLDDMYWYIYHQIDPMHLDDAAFWIVTVYLASIKSEGEHSNKLSRISIAGLYLASIYKSNEENSIVEMVECYHSKDFRTQAKLLASRLQKQCLHFFNLGTSSRPLARKFVTFSHRTVLDFLEQKSESILIALKERLGPSKDPYASCAVALGLDSSPSGKGPSDVYFAIDVYLAIINKIEQWLVLRGVVFEKGLHRQLKALLKELPSEQCAERNGIRLTATRDGWQAMSPKMVDEMAQNTDCLQQLLVVHQNRSLVGRHYRKRLNGMQKAQQEDLSLLLLGYINVSVNGESWKHESKLVPDVFNLFRPNYPCATILLTRYAELLRSVLLLYGVLFDDPEQIEIVIGLLESGADANVSCRSNALDSDKSSYSLLSLARKRKYRLQCVAAEYRTDFHDRYVRNAAGIEVALLEKGGREICEPCDAVQGPVNSPSEQFLRRILRVMRTPDKIESDDSLQAISQDRRCNVMIETLID